jgi:hypothetical protein
MKKNTAVIPVLTLCAAALFAMPALSRAQDTTNAPATAHAKPARKHSAAASATLPFHGTLATLDTNAMTLTVGKRTFNVTSETRITKDGKPAMLVEGVTGEPVRGSYKKAADGTLNAATVFFGAKAAGKKTRAAAPATGK